jgi:hypothetical protein
MIFIPSGNYVVVREPHMVACLASRGQEGKLQAAVFAMYLHFAISE